MTSILDLSYDDCFDYSRQVNEGKLNGIRFETDLNSKFLKVTSYDYWSNFDKNKSLNNNPSWSKTTKEGKIISDTILSNISTNIIVNNVSDISNIRKTSLDYSQYLNIIVHGNQTVDIGQVIEVEVPSPESVTDDMRSRIDMRWSGKYYVVAKRDMFTKQEYKTALTLSKESMIEKDVIT
jgi:hypothetical protein